MCFSFTSLLLSLKRLIFHSANEVTVTFSLVPVRLFSHGAKRFLLSDDPLEQAGDYPSSGPSHVPFPRIRRPGCPFPRKEQVESSCIPSFQSPLPPSPGQEELVLDIQWISCHLIVRKTVPGLPFQNYELLLRSFIKIIKAKANMCVS